MKNDWGMSTGTTKHKKEATVVSSPSGESKMPEMTMLTMNIDTMQCEAYINISVEMITLATETN